MTGRKKNHYDRPTLRAEHLAIGVYGDYGGGGEDDGNGCGGFSPVNFFNPLFQWCCS